MALKFGENDINMIIFIKKYLIIILYTKQIECLFSIFSQSVLVNVDVDIVEIFFLSLLLVSI